MSSYYVEKTEYPVEINGVWEKEPWKRLKPIQLKNVLKKKSNYVPKTEIKVSYDDKAIYVIFRVEDCYVQCVAKNYDDNVCGDSAVEFFFTPGSDISKGYFNLEMNCGGTALFHFQTMPFKNVTLIDFSDFAKIQVAHTMPKIVYPEIKEPITWILEYKIPFPILLKYAKDFVKPDTGVKWRANFYKVNETGSHPHWITWAKVKLTEYGWFHMPQYFGELIFK